MFDGIFWITDGIVKSTTKHVAVTGIPVLIKRLLYLALSLRQLNNEFNSKSCSISRMKLFLFILLQMYDINTTPPGPHIISTSRGLDSNLYMFYLYNFNIQLNILALIWRCMYRASYWNGCINQRDAHILVNKFYFFVKWLHVSDYH